MRKMLVDELLRKNQSLINSCHFLGLDTAHLHDIEHQLNRLACSYKMLGNSARYVWRTQGDGRVRDSHAANDGKIFSWDNPPPTGHPGEDFNCRCWGEPVGDSEYAEQTLTTPISDARRWTYLDFFDHYRNGGGATKTLAQIGYFAAIERYFRDYDL